MNTKAFPVALNLAGRACLVIGSGEAAESRAKNLIESGAEVSVVGSSPTTEVLALSQQGALALSMRDFLESDLDDKWLAVQTEPDPELALNVAQAAERRRVFFCAVDLPKLNSYSHMAIARAGSLFVAIGTEGRAPALARRLREELGRLLDEARAEDFVEKLAALRERTPSDQRGEQLGKAVVGLRLTGRLELPSLK
jgi:siroheme synthase-like protein